MPNTVQRTIEQRLAHQKTPEYEAHLDKRARKQASELGDWTRDRNTSMLLQRASREQIERALAPGRAGVMYNASDVRPATQHAIAESENAAKAQVRHNIHELLVDLCRVDVRAEDTRQIWCDPDLLEEDRIRLAYNNQVAGVARMKGTGESDFVRRFAALCAERREAEQYDDADAIKAAERRLDRLTGIPWPQLPQASWESADLLPATERQDEYDRLTEKYGPRASTNGHATKSSRRRLSTRPMPALETT